MRKIIDKIVRKKEGRKLCPRCDESNSIENQYCTNCGYEFDGSDRSTPEDNL